MNPYQVLRQVKLSEKTNKIREEENKYAFDIHPKASKLDVKKAVEMLFEVNVMAVNTILSKRKERRRGFHVGLASQKKKALVTLAEGQKLKIFEDQ